MKNSINLKTLRLFWRFTKPNKGLFWYGTIGAVIAILITDILPPLVISQAFNKIQVQLDAGQPLLFEDFSFYVWSYIGLVIAGIIAWRTQAWTVWRYGILTKKRMMEYLFDHLQKMDSKFHADRFGGALVSQVNKFVSAYDRFVGDFTWNILTGVTALIFSLAILYRTNWLYALVFTFAMIIYLSLIFWRMKKQAPFNRVLSSKESEQTAKLADNITNVATVRAFAGEKIEMDLFRKQTAITTGSELDLMRIQMKNELISQMGTSSINILAFSAGIISITFLDAPVGSLYLVISYTLSLTRRLWDSMFVMRNMNRIFGDAAEMTEILQLKPEVQDQPHAKQLKPGRGDIQFNKVTFSYSDSKDLILFKNLNLHIKPGEKVGFVGHSGSGKTTLSRLLLRFMDINNGAILVERQDIREVTQESLRNCMAYVPQEPLLFHRSLIENIRYSRPEATDEEVYSIARSAHAHEFIEKLPNGYETLVGERGVKLSGGQRQRVAIARAMLKNAPILVLDEATSALDSESEALIQDALWKLMEGRTTIVIAHRLSTIQKMDRIVVMDNGQIVEEGSHRELLHNGGNYAQLWARQSGGFLED